MVNPAAMTIDPPVSASRAPNRSGSMPMNGAARVHATEPTKSAPDASAHS